MTPLIHFTFGPACSDPEVLGPLLQRAPICRLNLSHMDPAALPDRVKAIRQLARELNVELQLGCDLRGRKLRIGPLDSGQVELRAGEPFALRPVAVDAETPGDATGASLNCPGIALQMHAGDCVLLDDGAVELRVERVQTEALHCVVVVGGTLPERSGCHLPGVALDLPPLTPFDLACLDALAGEPPDFFYLSFVERAADLAQLRQELATRGLQRPIIAKIERAAALPELEAIAASADQLCLARGDLGVELGLGRLPAAQRQVAELAHRVGTPLLLAGETLLTTVHRPQPSRAELTDLSVAIAQGMAGVVLSDETAVGVDPLAAVTWLQRLWTELSSTSR